MKSRKSPATIVDIAQKTGLSAMTVSRVLRGVDNHSLKTRERVQKAAQELHYRENFFAKALKGGKTGIVLCLFPHFSDFNSTADPFFSNPVFSEQLVLIESELLDHRHKVMLQSVSKNSTAEEIARMLQESYADGVIVHGITKPEILKAIQENHSCVIFIDENELNPSRMGLHNRKLGQVAAEYLWRLGHRTFSVFAHENDNYHQRRVDGFVQQISEFGANADTVIDIRYGDGWKDGGRELAKQFIENKIDATAIFCTNDGIASQAMSFFQQKSLSIPEKLSLIGCDNNPVSRVMTPKLTTVGHDRFLFAKKTVESLIEMIKAGNTEVAGFEIEPHVIERETTRKL